jgi:hypothetical protein
MKHGKTAAWPSAMLVITAAVSLAVLFVSVTAPATAAFSGGGSGTPADPYRITNVGQLQEMKDNLSASYILVNDIDASATIGWNGGAGFEPIGTFTGSFDGRRYKIYNLYVNRPDTDYIGLFGGVGSGGVVENVGLENVNINGHEYVGGLVGYNWGTVTNCYSTGTVSSNEHIFLGYNYVGGLVGQNQGAVSNCYSTGSVSGYYYAGGLVGFNGGTVSNSYSTSSVSGTHKVGGLVGYNPGTVSNSYFTGSVSGYQDVGGLVGLLGSIGTVSNSYSTSSVSGTYKVGGLVGRNDRGTVSSCYSTGTVSGGGDDAVGGLVGFNDHGIVSNSYSTSSVSVGNHDVGGLVGVNTGTVSNSYSTGSVSGGNWYVGGLVGANTGTVSNCYSTGSVSGGSTVGGLVGSNGGTVSNCYSTGTVSSSDNKVGGLVGNNTGTVTNSFWDNVTSGWKTSAGGTWKTTDNMKYVRTFTDNTWSENLTSPWDFVGNPYKDVENKNIWDINSITNNGYPFLTVFDTTAPPVPTLIAPTNGAVISDNTPTFVWTSVTDPSGVTYRIQVDNDPGFSSPEVNAWLLDNTYTSSALADENYSWRVRAVDGQGNASDWSEEWNFRVVPVSVSFTFNLWAGWNMISFPVMPDNKNPHSIFPGDYTMFRWDAVNKRYVLCTDENIENGVGYWVYVSAAENVAVSGTPVDSLTLTLSAGWNLIGSPLGGENIASPDDTPDNSVLPYAFTWDAENRRYTPPTSDLVAGAGYWVYALDNCVLRL